MICNVRTFVEPYSCSLPSPSPKQKQSSLNLRKKIPTGAFYNEGLMIELSWISCFCVSATKIPENSYWKLVLVNIN